MSKEIAILVPYPCVNKKMIDGILKNSDVDLTEWSANYCDFFNINNHVKKDNNYYCLVTFIKR